MSSDLFLAPLHIKKSIAIMELKVKFLSSLLDACLLSDSASSESNIEEEEATIPTASSQSKTVSCSAMAKHKV